MNGLTFYICIGKYGGWRFGLEGPAFRVVMGWVAVVITTRDIEQTLITLLDALNDKRCGNIDKSVG